MSSADLPVDERARLKAHFSSVPVEEHGKKWAELWDQDFLPWDKGRPSPALEDLLAERTSELGLDQPSGKRALVPGCGRGYDVLLFASYGVSSTGIEISPEAVEWARAHAKRQISDLSDEERRKYGEVTFDVGDFIKDEWVKGPREGGFDYVYDYTFLCAMPLALRPAWAKRMKQLVKLGTGYLICLEFPLYKSLELGGPPWGLTSAVYEELLSDGFEKMVHYKPERTHKIGEGTDYIAVWRRKSVKGGV